MRPETMARRIRDLETLVSLLQEEVRKHGIDLCPVCRDLSVRPVERSEHD